MWAFLSTALPSAIPSFDRSYCILLTSQTMTLSPFDCRLMMPKLQYLIEENIESYPSTEIVLKRGLWLEQGGQCGSIIKVGPIIAFYDLGGVGPSIWPWRLVPVILPLMLAPLPFPKAQFPTCITQWMHELSQQV